jgi:hypothetical protein
MTWWVLLAVLVLLALAVELRLRAVSFWYAEPNLWHDLLTQRKVRQMQRLGHADTVFVGASTVHYGIDPEVVDKVVGGGHVSYNAAVNRGLPILVSRWLDDVVLDTLRPRTVVLGLCLAELNPTEVYGRNRLKDDVASPVFRMSSAQRRLRRLEALAILRYLPRLRSEPRKLVAALLARRGPWARLRSDWRIEGHLAEGGVGTEVQGRQYWNGPKLMEVIKADVLSDFAVGGFQHEAITEISRRCGERGATLVLMETPVVEEALVPLLDSPDLVGTARRSLAVLAETLDAPLVDLTTVLPGTEFFADFLHVNGAGRARLSTAAAEGLRPHLPETP